MMPYRPFRNCVYEDRVAQSIREHSQNLGQQLVESLSCDPMHKFGAVLQVCVAPPRPAAVR
jgi:hypothetical protein